MHIETYLIRTSSSLMEFEFVSKGKKGNIIKVVQYSPTGIPGIFNLGFGDRNVITGQVSDSIISDNGDGQKVLATVASTVFKFLEIHPQCAIIAVGITQSRTRLYQIGISNNLSHISGLLDVFGYVNNTWEPFRKGKNYEAFMARKKR